MSAVKVGGDEHPKTATFDGYGKISSREGNFVSSQEQRVVSTREFAFKKTESGRKKWTLCVFRCRRSRAPKRN